MAMIDSLPESPTIIVAEAKVEHEDIFVGSIASCLIISNKKQDKRYQWVNVPNSAWNIFSRKDPSLYAGMPEFKAHPEMYQGDDKYFDSEDIHSAKVEIIVAPVHGELKIYYANNFSYFSDPDYIGTDKAVFLVTLGGYKIKTVFYFKVVSQEDYSSKIDELYETLCPDTEWLIDEQNEENGISSLMNLYDFSSVTITTSEFDKAMWAQTLGSGSNAQITFDILVPIVPDGNAYRLVSVGMDSHGNRGNQVKWCCLQAHQHPTSVFYRLAW